MDLDIRQDNKSLGHYTGSHTILLVGEGDFSFAKCLAKAFGSAGNMIATSLDSKGMLQLFYAKCLAKAFCSAVNMIATSLDSKETLMEKYSGAMTNVQELKDLGCTILHEVDAGTMKQHPQLGSKLFDRIVFNFPHAGFSHFYREHDDIMITLHKEVVNGFLRNARDMVTDNGEIHVTHKTAYPFNMWEIENLGEEVGLKLVEKKWFYIWEYAGYQNKRGDGSRSDQTFPVGECSTFKFAKRS